VPLDDDVDRGRLAALTVGFSGADLENLVNEAALLSGRENRETVNMESLLNARDKVVLGGKRELIIGDEEKALVAHHEAGYAIAASLLANADPLDKVTIIPHGRALGATELIHEEEHYNLRRSCVYDRIGVMLGGRAAEQLIFDEVSSGAEDDLKQATRLARHMVTHRGMSEKLGPVAFRRGEGHIFLGHEMTQQRDFSEHTPGLSTMKSALCSSVSNRKLPHYCSSTDRNWKRWHLVVTDSYSKRIYTAIVHDLASQSWDSRGTGLE